MIPKRPPHPAALPAAVRGSGSRETAPSGNAPFTSAVRRRSRVSCAVGRSQNEYICVTVHSVAEIVDDLVVLVSQNGC